MWRACKRTRKPPASLTSLLGTACASSIQKYIYPSAGCVCVCVYKQMRHTRKVRSNTRTQTQSTKSLTPVIFRPPFSGVRMEAGRCRRRRRRVRRLIVWMMSRTVFVVGRAVALSPCLGGGGMYVCVYACAC